MPVVPEGGTERPADDRLRDELAGLDALELAATARAGRAGRLWSATWPKLAALALVLLAWQGLVWAEWRPRYALRPPADVWDALWANVADGTLPKAIRITLQRAVLGFGLAVLIGAGIGAVTSRVRVVRSAVGSLITGLQTMPSIAWFPLSILLFGITEQAITFVVVLGAAPSIANGLISGSDHIPPLLLRAGRMLGASRLSLYRHVILPASLPSFVGGLKQGWAFAWRSLMAGELLVIVENKPSIGQQLQFSRDLNDGAGLLASMIVILAIGIVVDSLVFGVAERSIRRRWGLVDGGD